MTTNTRGDAAAPSPPRAPTPPAVPVSAALTPQDVSSQRPVEAGPDLRLFRGSGFFLGSGN